MKKIPVEQAIGMTLFEEVRHDAKGRLMNDSFLTYKIPTRLEAGTIRVEFDSSYEPTGPFGAKSIGELVINTPAPAIAEAIRRATGISFRSLPILPEHIAMALAEQKK